MSDPVALTEERICQLAPDGKVTRDGRQLAASNAYRDLRRSEDGSWLQGRCQGSLPTPYRVSARFDGAELRCRCDCDSRKFPCKHAIGLLLTRLHRPEEFTVHQATDGWSSIVEGPVISLPAEAVAAPPPSDVGQALLQAIESDPEEIAHRLVYADWLDEQGDAADRARAELIRVQYQLEQADLPAAHRAALQRQEKALLRAHGEAWLGSALCPPPGGVIWRCGFVSGLNLTAKVLRGSGAGYCAAHPITSVRIRGGLSHQEVSKLAVCAFWQKVRRLEIARMSATLPQLVELLLNNELLGNLRRLVLSGNRVASHGATVLARWRGLSRLDTLELNSCAIGDSGVGALATADLATLRRLELSDNPLGNAAASALADSPGLAGLIQLNLADTRLGPSGARALAESPHLGKLQRLDLAGIALPGTVRTLLRERFGAAVLLDES